MVDLKTKVSVEADNLESLAVLLEGIKDVHALKNLELAGTAAYLHNFYNAMENILKQILIERGSAIPRGASWHRDLVALAVHKKVISRRTSSSVIRYLAFRHFFSHGYAVDLDADRLEPLIKDAGATCRIFLKNIKKCFD
jgi:hypothetical protein